MRMDPNFEIVSIAGDYILVPVGERMESFNGTIVLNETSAYILEQLKTEKSIEGILHLLVEKYDVDFETARKDVDELINKMRKAGILNE